jgi:hypothetical protein
MKTVDSAAAPIRSLCRLVGLARVVVGVEADPARQL